MDSNVYGRLSDLDDAIVTLTTSIQELSRRLDDIQQDQMHFAKIVEKFLNILEPEKSVD